LRGLEMRRRDARGLVVVRQRTVSSRGRTGRGRAHGLKQRTRGKGKGEPARNRRRREPKRKRKGSGICLIPCRNTAHPE
jgi:hypothetical protein